MPQAVTYSVSAKFDKGPELKSEAKVDVGSYAGVIEELLCKCSGWKKFDLPHLKKKNLEMLIVSADKYLVDKDCPATNGGATGQIEWGINAKGELEGASTPATHHPLTRPLVLQFERSDEESIEHVWFKNGLTADVKVSVLAILKK